MSRTSAFVAIMTGVLVVGLGAVHWALLASRHAQIAALEEETTSILVALKSQVGHDRIKELQDQLRLCEPSLPANEEGASLLRQLGPDLDKLGVVDRSLTTGVVSAHGAIQRVSMTLKFKSSFVTAHELLQRMADYSCIVNITRLTIADEGRADDGILTISMQMETFARTTKEIPRWSELSKPN